MDDSIDVAMKYCNKCNQTKPLTDFPKDKNKAGYSSPCKACKNAQTRERYHANLPKDFDADPSSTKICTKCREIKSIEDFPKKAAKAGGYKSKCKDCINEWRRGRRKDAREKAPKRVYTPKIMDREYPTEKKCTRCQEIKPAADFAVNPRRGDYLNSWCKKCSNESRRENYDFDFQRAKRLKHIYKITEDEYQAMFDAQGGVCASCGNPETMIDPRTHKVKRLSIDHNHETGEIRALLCQECNFAFGWAREDPQRILALLNYAYRWQSQDHTPKIG